mmetsp:Transcript_100130/g.188602  ORF Transcript_100130/g.188602 Transcript_100130/m.188602 type:complete len:431 (+) Transcript_100130:37-1329(+)
MYPQMCHPRLSCCDGLDLRLPTAAGVRKVALIIGQQSYNEDGGFAPLGAALSDVDSVQASLECFGFHKVLCIKDATHSDFPALQKMLLQALGGQKGLVLVHYSGHGLLSPAGQTYLLPVDAKRGSCDTYINLHKFLQPLHDVISTRSRALAGRTAAAASALPAPGSTAVVLMDCCLAFHPEDSEPEKVQPHRKRSFEDMTRAGHHRARDSEMCIIYACDDNNYAREGSQGGFLTQSFLETLKNQPGANIYEVFEGTVERCLSHTRFRQRPWMKSCLQHGTTLIIHSQRQWSWQRPVCDISPLCRLTTDSAMAIAGSRGAKHLRNLPPDMGAIYMRDSRGTPVQDLVGQLYDSIDDGDNRKVMMQVSSFCAVFVPEDDLPDLLHQWMQVRRDFFPTRLTFYRRPQDSPAQHQEGRGVVFRGHDSPWQELTL